MGQLRLFGSFLSEHQLSDKQANHHYSKGDTNDDPVTLHTKHWKQGDHKGCHRAHDTGWNAEGIIGTGLAIRVGAAAQRHAGGGGAQALAKNDQNRFKPVFTYPASAKEETNENTISTSNEV